LPRFVDLGGIWRRESDYLIKNITLPLNPQSPLEKNGEVKLEQRLRVRSAYFI